MIMIFADKFLFLTETNNERYPDSEQFTRRFQATETAPKTSKYEFLSNDEFFIETAMGDLEEVRSNERYR